MTKDVKYAYVLKHVDFEGNELVSSFNAESLDEVLRQIRYFLQGVSFTIKGELVVDDVGSGGEE